MRGGASELSITFIPSAEVKAYLGDHTGVARPLRNVSPDGAPPVNVDSVADRCPRVFAILLLIEMADFIMYFVQDDELKDRPLPFRPFDETSFPKLINASNLLVKFRER
jgi:hypothetical protein